MWGWCAARWRRWGRTWHSTWRHICNRLTRSTYALLRDIAPLVGVQIGPEHEMASLEELPVFSPAGGAIVSPPGKGELAPARKPPGLRPKDLSGAMEVEKERAESTEEGVVPEKENGSNTADGGLVKDKKKKK